MNTFKVGVVVSWIIIVIGLCGLLENLDFLPGVDWFLVGGLATAGKLLFYLSGLNKVSFVLGLFLVVASLLTIFHQLDLLPSHILLPLLLMVFGGLLLGAFVLRLRMPDCLKPVDEGVDG